MVSFCKDKEVPSSWDKARGPIAGLVAHSSFKGHNAKFVLIPGSEKGMLSLWTDTHERVCHALKVVEGITVLLPQPVAHPTHL